MFNDNKYVSGATISKQFDITSQTLRRWAEEGKIKFIRPNGTRRLYDFNDIQTILYGKTNSNKIRKQAIYARVSSSHQKEDLDRQISFLRDKYPNAIVFKDFASGLNWNRQGFKALLEKIHSGFISEVIVSYRDRLCRFGFELVQWICDKSNTKIMVLNQNESDSNSELSEDLLSIVTVFVAKNNGKRSVKYRREREDK